MLCKKPFRNGVMEYGCGQCMPCRVNKSREWVGRMMMESMEHQCSCFITLTFNEESLPGADLDKRPLQLFLKRLRQKVGAIRYFAVGEYGDQTWRPHYHLIVFGVSPVQEELIRSCWTLGYVQVGTAELASMNYIVGYVLKKMTTQGLGALQGRSPEFALMSQKPGLGYGVVERIKKAFKNAPASDILMGVMPALKSVRVCVERNIRSGGIYVRKRWTVSDLQRIREKILELRPWPRLQNARIYVLRSNMRYKGKQGYSNNLQKGK